MQRSDLIGTTEEAIAAQPPSTQTKVPSWAMLEYDSDSSAGEPSDAFQINKLVAKKPRIDEPSSSASVAVSAAPDVLLEVRIPLQCCVNQILTYPVVGPFEAE